MKKYFIYELKKSTPSFLILSFIAIVFYVMPLALEGETSGWATTYLAYLMTVICIACMVIPANVFSYRMKRRSTDLYFSLPISRTKLFIVKYIVGFITIFAAFTVAYVLGFIFVAIKFNADLYLGYYAALYFAIIIPFYIVYSIFSYAYTRANSHRDGVVFIIFAALAMFMVALLLSNILGSTFYYTVEENGSTEYYLRWYINEGYYFPFIAVDEVTCFFQDMIDYNNFETANLFRYMNEETINMLISMLLFTAISATCTYGMFKTEKNRKAENCNQISDSVFGYKTMLPLFLLTFSSLFGGYAMFSALYIIPLIILFGSTYGFAVMYKKSYKIGWKFALVLIASALLGIAINLILS